MKHWILNNKKIIKMTGGKVSVSLFIKIGILLTLAFFVFSVVAF